MVDETLIEMTKELKEILGQITGVEAVQEGFSLNYVVVVKDEASKSNVDNVAAELMKQARARNLELEIISATQAEVDDAKKRLISAMS